MWRESLTLRDEFAERFFSGRELYGDDFDLEQIRSWYEAEKDDYARQVPVHDKEKYPYYRLNWRNCFRHLPRSQMFERVLGFGSAYGDELRPVLPRARKVTIVDSSDHFAASEIDGHPVSFLKPSCDGKLAFVEMDALLCWLLAWHVRYHATTCWQKLRPGAACYVLRK